MVHREIMILPHKSLSAAGRLRTTVTDRTITPFIGIFDAFSATIAAQHFDGLFVSGYGFAASYYGLPDIGFIAWPDMVAFVQRLRTILPQHHLLVDIDDGYADVEVACHVTRLLETVGASGIILEDQQRPRRCGHVDGKQIMELDDFLVKLERVLTSRSDLFVVARTDSSDPDDIRQRAVAFENCGADAVLVDGLKDLDLLRQLSNEIACPLVFNQIAGGKSPPCTLEQLADAGVSLVNYSTPCLFAAQAAIDNTMRSLKANDGGLANLDVRHADLKSCQHVLEANIQRRHAA